MKNFFDLDPLLNMLISRLNKLKRVGSEEYMKPAKGVVHIKAIAPDGSVLWEDTTENLIVNDAKEQLINLITAAQTVRHITTIAVGTSGTATAATDTAPLTGQFSKAIDSFALTLPNIVTISWSLSTSEANGTTIQELGLICSNGKLFSRLTRASIAKTSGFSIAGTWTITF